MRSIIFTSLAIALAGPAVSAANITKGCFLRDYDAAHLAKHPAQVVDWIRMDIFADEYGETVAYLDVFTANQGHARRDGLGGQVLSQALFCWEKQDGQTGCSVECDGGTAFITRDDGNTLVFRTKNLLVGDTESCGGAMDIAEVPGTFTTYRLNRAVPAACEDN